VIVLDTNVVSELMRREPAPAVIDWVDRQDPGVVYLTAISLTELLFGIARLADGRRKSTLAGLLDELVADDFEHRVLAFDTVAAAHCADIAAGRERIGRPMTFADAQIAAICRSHGALLVTRNVLDFDATGVGTLNPWNVG
jgi:predicted nucleic acid-binding protein